LSNDLLDGGDGIRELCKSALGVALAEAQAPERLKSLCPRIGSRGAHDAAVGRAVRVGETRRGSRARDDEPALMNGAVMSSAKRDEIFRVVVAAFGLKPDVVRLDKDRVSAPGNATFPAVPAQDCTPGCRRDDLRSAD